MEKQLVRNCKMVAFLLSFGTNLLAPLLLAIRKDLGIDLADSGMLMSCFFAGNFLSCIFCAKISRMFGEQRLLTIATASMSIFGIGITCAPNFMILCIMMLGFGISSLLLQVTTSVLPGKVLTENSEAVISGITAFNGLGACVGLAFSGVLSTIGLSWRMIYLAFAVFGVCTMISCIRTPRFEILQDDFDSSQNIFHVIKDTRFTLVFLSLILYSGTEMSVSNWMTTFLVEEHGFTATGGSMISAVIWISAFVGRILCENLSKRMPEFKLELILIPLSALTVIVFPMFRGIGFWIGAVAIGFAISGLWPLIAAKLFHESKYDRFASMSTAFMCSFSGGIIIPYFTGIAGERTSMASAIRLNGYIFVILFIIYGSWLIKNRKKKQKEIY